MTTSALLRFFFDSHDVSEVIITKNLCFIIFIPHFFLRSFNYYIIQKILKKSPFTRISKCGNNCGITRTKQKKKFTSLNYLSLFAAYSKVL